MNELKRTAWAMMRAYGFTRQDSEPMSEKQFGEVMNYCRSIFITNFTPDPSEDLDKSEKD